MNFPMNAREKKLVDENDRLHAQVVVLRSELDALAKDLKALRKQKPLAWRNPHNGAVIDAGRKNQEGVGGGYPNFSQPLYAAPVPPAAVTVTATLAIEPKHICAVEVGIRYLEHSTTESVRVYNLPALRDLLAMLAATPAPVAPKVPDGVVLPDHEPTIAIGEILDGYDGDDREDVWDSIKAYADVHARAALEAASIPVLNEAPSLWVAFSDSGANIRMWSAEGPEKISDAGLTPMRFMLAATHAPVAPKVRTEWFCDTCDRILEPREVTFDERHDERCGGCGVHVGTVKVAAAQAQEGKP